MSARTATLPLSGDGFADSGFSKREGGWHWTAWGSTQTERFRPVGGPGGTGGRPPGAGASVVRCGAAAG